MKERIEIKSKSDLERLCSVLPVPMQITIDGDIAQQYNALVQARPYTYAELKQNYMEVEK